MYPAAIQREFYYRKDEGGKCARGQLAVCHTVIEIFGFFSFFVCLFFASFPLSNELLAANIYSPYLYDSNAYTRIYYVIDG